jgi:hypothetical protein
MLPVSLTAGILIFNSNPPRVVTTFQLIDVSVLDFHINHVGAFPNGGLKR